MVAWDVADSLIALKDQLNAAFPNRSKVSDGFIGDAAHQSRDSDHNPWWEYRGRYYVTAFDVTHDPAAGADGHKLSSALVTAKDPRIKYLIWNGMIWDSRWVVRGSVNNKPWTPLWYLGSDPHTNHVHVSVLPIAASLTSTPWSLPGLTATTTTGDDTLPSVDEVWAEPIDDYYRKGAKMPVGAGVGWAAANAAWARDAAADAVAGVKRVEAKLDRLIAKMGA